MRVETAPRWERKLAEVVQAITAAAIAYEARWTLAALHRVDTDLHARLRRQIGLWQEASRHGEADDIVAQGEALVRGYRRAVERMAEAGEPDDAYAIGTDEASGLTIAIGHQVAAADRVAALYPDKNVCFCTPDEIAMMLGSVDNLRATLQVKRAWPGAVAVEIRERNVKSA